MVQIYAVILVAATTTALHGCCCSKCLLAAVVVDDAVYCFAGTTVAATDTGCIIQPRQSNRPVTSSPEDKIWLPEAAMLHMT